MGLHQRGWPDYTGQRWGCIGLIIQVSNGDASAVSDGAALERLARSI